MHDLTNTLGGRFGFVATLEGGGRLSEFDVLWDEIPANAKIVALGIAERTGKMLVELEGFKSYFFSNEAVAQHSKSGLLSGQSQVVAKLLGGIRGEEAVEVRVDLTTETPRGSSRSLPRQKLRLHPRAFRQGVQLGR